MIFCNTARTRKELDQRKVVEVSELEWSGRWSLSGDNLESGRIQFSSRPQQKSLVAAILTEVFIAREPVLLIPREADWSRHLLKESWQPLGEFIARQFSSFGDSASVILNRSDETMLGLLIQNALLFGWCVSNDLLLLSAKGDLSVLVEHDDAVSYQAAKKVTISRLRQLLRERDVDFEEMN